MNTNIKNKPLEALLEILMEGKIPTSEELLNRIQKEEKKEIEVSLTTLEK